MKQKTGSDEGIDQHTRKITKITTQKRKGRYNIFIDGEYAFPVDESVLIKYMLKKGMVVSKDLEKQIIASDTVQKAYQRSLSYLSHNLRSEKQVRDDLIAKGYEDQADAVIIKLKDMRLINDLEFAKSYVRTAALINRKGPKRIKGDLVHYGIAENMQLTALDEYPVEQQEENAVHLGMKKIRTLKKQSTIETKSKIKQFLLQKGYDMTVIENALSQLDYEKSDEEEWQALLKQANKAWKRYSRKFAAKERDQKVRANLYQKGFSTDLITRYLEEKADEND